LSVPVSAQSSLAVDPDNRLVADTLKADWNDALRHHQAAQDEYEQATAANATLDDERKQRIRQLPTDFPRLWSDPATPQRERKRMTRRLIEDVTLNKTDQIYLHVRFRGGQTTSLATPIPQLPRNSGAASARLGCALNGECRSAPLYGPSGRLGHLRVTLLLSGAGRLEGDFGDAVDGASGSAGVGVGQGDEQVGLGGVKRGGVERSGELEQAEAHYVDDALGAAHEDRVVAVLCRLVVEVGVGDRQRLKIVGVAGRLEAGVSVGHRVQRGRWHAVAGGEGGDRGVDGHPGGDGVAGLCSVDDRHAGVTGRRELDDPELAQPQQRFADRRARDTKLGGELVVA
jgi:hypothetical protein